MKKVLILVRFGFYQEGKSNPETDLITEQHRLVMVEQDNGTTTIELRVKAQDKFVTYWETEFPDNTLAYIKPEDTVGFY